MASRPASIDSSISMSSLQRSCIQFAPRPVCGKSRQGHQIDSSARPCGCSGGRQRAKGRCRPVHALLFVIMNSARWGDNRIGGKDMTDLSATAMPVALAVRLLLRGWTPTRRKRPALGLVEPPPRHSENLGKAMTSSSSSWVSAPKPARKPVVLPTWLNVALVTVRVIPAPVLSGATDLLSGR